MTSALRCEWITRSSFSGSETLQIRTHVTFLIDQGPWVRKQEEHRRCSLTASLAGASVVSEVFLVLLVRGRTGKSVPWQLCPPCGHPQREILVIPVETGVLLGRLVCLCWENHAVRFLRWFCRADLFKSNWAETSTRVVNNQFSYQPNSIYHLLPAPSFSNWFQSHPKEPSTYSFQCVFYIYSH